MQENKSEVRNAEEPDSEPDSKLSPWQTARDVALISVCLGGLIAWVTPPSPPEKYEPMGMVQGIRFFTRGFSLVTQLDARAAEGAERSFVVARTTRFVKGQAVYLHKAQFRDELCNAEKTQCEVVLGDPL